MRWPFYVTEKISGTHKGVLYLDKDYRKKTKLRNLDIHIVMSSQIAILNVYMSESDQDGYYQRCESIIEFSRGIDQFLPYWLFSLSGFSFIRDNFLVSVCQLLLMTISMVYHRVIMTIIYNDYNL